MLTLTQIRVGDRLSYWHYTGCFGAQLCYADVLKLGKVKVRVRDEFGTEAWCYPGYFHQVERPADACRCGDTRERCYESQRVFSGQPWGGGRCCPQCIHGPATPDRENA